jgi:hypothetical protein
MREREREVRKTALTSVVAGTEDARDLSECKPNGRRW